MDEVKLEKLAVDKAKQRYRATVSHYKENREECETAVGRLALANLSPFVEEALDKWKVKAATQAGRGHAAFPLLDALPLETTALLISRAILNSLSSVKSITSLHMAVGSAIAQEQALDCYRRQSPEWFSVIQKSVWRNRGTQRQTNAMFQTLRKRLGELENTWTMADKLRAGVVGLDLFVASTGVVEIQTRYDSRRNKNKSVVVPTASMMEWLENAHTFREELRPLFTPMVSEPVPWTSYDTGGFLTVPTTLVKSQADYSHLTPKSAPEVYEAVNRVQSTGWAVNQDVLKVVRHLYDNQVELPGLPTKEPIPLPTKPTDIEDNPESRKAYGAAKAWVLNANNKRKNRKLTVARLLQQAEEYSQYPEFYFVQQLDFRGRMYSTSTGLNNQGDDLNRSLLKFSVGKPLTTDEQRKAYKVQGANHYGLTSETLDDRIAWVDNASEDLVNVGREPLNHMSFWLSAKDPFQFMAWCIEYAAIQADPSTPSSLPCSIDGTNNGCQIWSLIMRDRKTGEATNCTDLGSPQDLYADVAADVSATLEEGFFAKEWRRIGIDRSTVKHGVMIIPYSATLAGVANTIYDWLQKKRVEGTIDPSWRSDYQGANYLAKQVWRVLPDHIPAVLQGKEYLQSCVALAFKQQEGVSWTLPTGLQVTNKYMKKVLRKVRTNLGQRYHVSYVQEPTLGLSGKRQKQTITANFTHSMDSALLTKTVCAATAVSHFSMVHDSYGCHAADLPVLAHAVREAASQLFSVDVLQDFRDQLCKQLPDIDFPQPPHLGDLNPSEVLHSTYFFN